MSPEILPDEVKGPEARALLLAYLAVVGDRVRILTAYREAGAPGMSMLDLAILQLVSTFEIVDGEGSRQQEIVSALHAPRRTVRDGLARMVEAGMLIRRANGCYHPTTLTITIFLEVWPEHLKLLRRCGDAVLDLDQGR